MSWLPTFSGLGAAAIAAGLTIPALLVLYFLKLRRKEVPVASTLLWRKAVQDLQVNAPFQKLRRNLLLLLQLILLLLLLLALARPEVNYTPPPGKTTVLLIDRSASMAARDMDGGKSRLDVAKQRAKDLIDSMPDEGKMMVVAFDDSADAVQGFTSERAQLKAAIDRIQPTDRKTDVSIAYQRVSGATNINPDAGPVSADALPDVRVFSDGRIANTDEASIVGVVRHEKVGSTTAKNVAIVTLSAKRNYERPTQVQVFARLANFGPEPVSVPIRLSVDDEAVGTQNARADELYLLPDRWLARPPAEQPGDWAQTVAKHRDSVEFRLDLAREAIIKLEQLKTEGDVMPADDVARVVVPPPKAMSVLLVTDGSGHFLAKALAALPIKQPVDVMQPGTYDAKPPTGYDVVIFNNFKPKAVPESGNYIWFNAVPNGVKAKQAAGDAGVVENVRVLDWKRTHPILADLALGQLYFAKTMGLLQRGDQEVLMEGLKGPLIVFERTDKAIHLINAFDPLDSDWPLRQSFPLYLHQAMLYLTVGAQMEVRQTLSPGETLSLPRAALEQAATQAGGTLKRIKVIGPGGARELPVPDGGNLVLPPFEHVGLYKTEPAVPGYEQIAVNLLSVAESNTLPADQVPAATNVKSGDAGGGGSGGRQKLELWWWLALAALAVLTIEWWVYTRRVHL